MNFSDLIKTAIMHPLQERVVGLGVCPKCHVKALRPVHEAEGVQFNQCRSCLTVYVAEGGNDTVNSHVTEPHPYDSGCMVAGCALCREKFLNEHIDTLPDAARGEPHST